MVKLRFSNHDSDEAKHYFAVSRNCHRLFDAINKLEGASRLDCSKYREEALNSVNALVRLRENHIPLGEVEELAQRTRIAIHTLAQNKAGLTERTKETVRELGDLALSAKNHAEQLSDCLLGLTKAFERFLREKIAEKDREMAGQQEDKKKHTLFSRLKFWKRPED